MSVDDSFLELTGIVPDETTHIFIKKERLCLNRCARRPCTFICPTLVYRWDEDAGLIRVRYERCVECGACAPACPRNNIDLHYPRGGYGKILTD
jgi:ferredoxin like protein